LYINIEDKLPKDLHLEVASRHEDVTAMYEDEGLGVLVQPFYERAKNEFTKNEASWHMWEGYYVEHGDSSNLYVVGILMHRNIFFVRAMRVKGVSTAQRKEVEKSISEMMIQYLEVLMQEMDRIVPPGMGKSGEPWNSTLWIPD